MILTEVQVVAPVGTKFGLLESPTGVLTIVCRPPASPDWPHGLVPERGLNEIAPGHTRYVVMDDLPPENGDSPCSPPSS